MMTGFGMGFGFIWMILFWVLVIGGSIALLAAIFPKLATTHPNGTAVEDDALFILKKRYAQGELSKEEFETVRQDLEQA
ncbi:MAG: SHOCT domain-containing protein [Anaerolineales bacterium]|nr:SHOCT domain-containing protein [Anaerolineales bacterium]